MSETSTKPYLIRAIHEWCADNGYRPYIAVVVDERTVVPMEFVRNGEIVLNVSADATSHLVIGNDLIEFEARFNRVARQVSVPIENVSAIYAAENGHGMAFEVARAQAAPTSADAEPSEEPGDELGDQLGEKGGERRGEKRSEKRDGSEADAQGKGPGTGLRVVGVSPDQSTDVPVRAAGSARPAAPAPRPALLEAVPSGKRPEDAPGPKDSDAGDGDTDNDPSPKAPSRRKPRLTRVK